MIEGIAKEETPRLEILDKIPFKPDISRIRLRLLFHKDYQHIVEILPEMIKRVLPVARPKAIYKVSRVTGKRKDSVEIDGVRFTSHLLRVNLKSVDTVFPYVISCGRELDSIEVPESDESRRYCLEIIKEKTMEAAYSYLLSHILRKYALDYLWSLSPGEYQAWPIVDQKLLLSIIPEAEESIGVKITENGSLYPACSRSGLFYYSEVEFENCQVCSQEPCMGRRAPYNAELAKKFMNRARRPCGSKPSSLPLPGKTKDYP